MSYYKYDNTRAKTCSLLSEFKNKESDWIRNPSGINDTYMYLLTLKEDKKTNFGV